MARASKIFGARPGTNICLLICSRWLTVCRSRLESEEYLTIQEIKAWLGVRRVEVELGQERPLEDVSLDLVLERRWVRTFLHTLYLVVHLSDL
jgi:hypothetical protein